MDLEYLPEKSEASDRKKLMVSDGACETGTKKAQITNTGVQDAMKILVDVRSMGTKPSGVGMYLYNFINAMSEKTKIEISLISDIAESNEILTLQKKGLKLFLYGKQIGKSVGLYGYFRFVQKCIHEEKPDIFWEGNNMVPVKIVNPYGKFIVTIYDVFPVSTPEHYSKIYQKYFKWGIHNTLKYVDGIVYDSNDAKKETEKYFPKAKQKKSCVSYIIIDDMPKLQISDKKYFLYMGNLEKRKGTDLLLETYEAYVKEGGERELYLAGKVREDEIQAQLDALLAKTDKAHYLGYITEEEKWKRYAECGCFLFPSMAEGFGMPVLEALNYGKPVIASNLAVFRELEGELVNYFELSQNKKMTVRNMICCMKKFDAPDKGKCLELLKHYKKENLTEEMESFFYRLLK